MTEQLKPTEAGWATTPQMATSQSKSTAKAIQRECLRLFRSQLEDRNAMSPLTLAERLERGYRIAECARVILEGPPYEMPRWMSDALI